MHDRHECLIDEYLTSRDIYGRRFLRLDIHSKQVKKSFDMGSMIRQLKRFLQMDDTPQFAHVPRSNVTLNERMISLSFQLQELESLATVLKPLLQIKKSHVISSRMNETELNTLIQKRSILILVYDTIDMIQDRMHQLRKNDSFRSRSTVE